MLEQLKSLDSRLLDRGGVGLVDLTIAAGFGLVSLISGSEVSYLANLCWDLIFR